MATSAEELAETEARRAQYILAEAAVLKGQAYTIGARQMRRADLSEIRAGIREFDAKLAELRRGGRGIRLRGMTPVT